MAAAEYGPGTRALLDSNDCLNLLKHYFTNPEQATDLRIAVIRNKSLKDLPPATLVTCEVDPLRDEGRAYGEKLKVGVYRQLRCSALDVRTPRNRGLLLGSLRHACPGFLSFQDSVCLWSARPLQLLLSTDLRAHGDG